MKKYPKKEYLLTPGPTPLPDEVRKALGRQIIHHRTPAYQEIFSRVEEGLKYVFKTKNPVLVFTSSGTGAMEAAVSNLLSPGDKAIVVKGGKFAERWAKLCQAYNVEVVPIDVAYGDAVKPGLIEKELDGLKAQGLVCRAVFTTLCETSTGVLNDIETVGKLVNRTDSVLVVDAISGLCADELMTDEWNVDVVVSGSQKGLMLPPGLSFVAISDKAWKHIHCSKLPKFYFDFNRYKKSLDENDTPFTSAISLVIALDESLKLIKEKGLDNILRNHKELAQETRAAVEAMGLKVFAKSPSNGVTSVCVPDGVDGKKLVRLLRDRHKITIAGGQAELAGKIFRIAHMGHITQQGIKFALSKLKTVLIELGYDIRLKR